MTFSRASRRRLLRCLATIDLEKVVPSVFVTLTYPDAVLPNDPGTRTAQRSHFVLKMERLLNREISGLWRCEWEDRKSGDNTGKYAPHFHLLLFNVNFIHWQKVRTAWQEVIQHTGYVRTEIRRPRHARSAAYYVSKYLAKVQDLSLVNHAYLNKGGLGRPWGWLRPESIPRLPSAVIGTVTGEDLDALMELAFEVWPRNEIEYGDSFTLLGRQIPDGVKRIFGIDLTPTREGG